MDRPHLVERHLAWLELNVDDVALGLHDQPLREEVFLGAAKMSLWGRIPDRREPGSRPMQPFSLVLAVSAIQAVVAAPPHEDSRSRAKLSNRWIPFRLTASGAPPRTLATRSCSSRDRSAYSGRNTSMGRRNPASSYWAT